MGVDVNGRTSQFVDASYHHHFGVYPDPKLHLKSKPFENWTAIDHSNTEHVWIHYVIFLEEIAMRGNNSCATTFT